MIPNNTAIRRRLMIFKLRAALLGVVIALIGVMLMYVSWSGVGFLAGFLLFTGIQIFCWVIGIRSELLGNVTDDVFDWQGEEETSYQASSAVRQ